MAQPGGAKENYLLVVLSVSLVLGMATGAGVYLLWRSGAIAPGINVLSMIALLLCPPFIMSVASPPIVDSDLAVTLLLIAMVFGNGFLYAGAAAVSYFVFEVILHRQKAR